MKISLRILLLVCIFYSCKNEKPINKNISIKAKNEVNLKKIKVLTLGSFHFDFPNLDVAKTDTDDQIDVLDSKYQKEIELIVDKLKKFEPTKIDIERRSEKQPIYDSLYISYQ